MKFKLVSLTTLMYLLIFTGCTPMVTTPVRPTLSPTKTAAEQTSSTALPSTPISATEPTEHIVFSSHEEGSAILGLIDSSGQNLRYLTALPGNSLLPKWSPDGQSIAYLSDYQIPVDEYGQQYYNLWQYNLATQQVKPLTQDNDISYLTGYSWAPTSDKILYNPSRGAAKVLHLRDLSIDTPGTYLSAPFAWSKRGEIAITDPFIDPVAIVSLAILDGNYQPILPPAEGFRTGGHYGLNTTSSLAWHPEGGRLAIGSQFAARGDGDLRIVTIKDDTVVVLASLAETFGSEEFQSNTFAPPSDVTEVVWSPDGTKLAFQFNHQNNEQIYLTNENLTMMQALTPIEMRCYYPQWSPDSTRLAFTCRGQADDDQKDIWIVNADGSDLYSLTQTPNMSEETPMWQP